jgi:hypothetical protein
VTDVSITPYSVTLDCACAAGIAANDASDISERAVRFISSPCVLVFTKSGMAGDYRAHRASAKTKYSDVT